MVAIVMKKNSLEVLLKHYQFRREPDVERLIKFTRVANPCQFEQDKVRARWKDSIVWLAETYRGLFPRSYVPLQPICLQERSSYGQIVNGTTATIVQKYITICSFLTCSCPWYRGTLLVVFFDPRCAD